MFQGKDVVTFESRRATEIAELIRINGGVPFVAPALQEAPLAANSAAHEFERELWAGAIDCVVLLTGVGTRYLEKVIGNHEKFLEALRRVAVIPRGPKPAAVLREWNVPIAASVPPPHTWREVLATVTARPEQRIAVQEYGRSNEELLAGLRRAGKDVLPVPVYQWMLPDDTAPLSEALARLIDGGFDIALFTTGVQINHLLQFADTRANQVKEALRNIFIASIGPDCSEALRDHGIEPAMEPSTAKMGLLVREAAQAYSAMKLGA